MTTQNSSQDIPKIQRIIAVLWPSFITAGIATIIVFTVFDPQLIWHASGYGEISRLAGYSMGFFAFWLLTSSTCALTCYFQKPCHKADSTSG